MHWDNRAFLRFYPKFDELFGGRRSWGQMHEWLEVPFAHMVRD